MLSLRTFRASSVLVIILVAPMLSGRSSADRFRLNQIQVLGSHNSYKRAIDPQLFALLRKTDPKAYASLEYSHVTFAEQLDLGLRKLEIDIVYDPKGGLYANPIGLQIEQQSGAKNILPYDPDKEMLKPGMKVIHVPDIDFRSQAYTFRGALRQLRAWSDAHPRHFPIAITMNAKDEGPAFRMEQSRCRSMPPPSTHGTRRSVKFYRPKSW